MVTDTSVRDRTRKRKPGKARYRNNDKANANVNAKKAKAKRNRLKGVSQKVWGQHGARVTPPTVRRSRRHKAVGSRDDERGDVVKTLRDATLKMNGLRKMVGEFVVTSKKINYKKVHAKWRKMKKQIQFGGVRGDGGDDDDDDDDGDGVGGDEKECLEKKERPTFLVKQSAANSDKFVVERIDKDPVIEGSFTKTAELLMKSGENPSDAEDGEADTDADDIPIIDSTRRDAAGDAGDDLSIAAAGVILIALEVLKSVPTHTSDDLSRAAAAMIAIALGGLIRTGTTSAEKEEEVIASGLRKELLEAKTRAENAESRAKDAETKAESVKQELKIISDQAKSQELIATAETAKATRLQVQLAADGGDNASLRAQILAANQAADKATRGLERLHLEAITANRERDAAMLDQTRAEADAEYYKQRLDTVQVEYDGAIAFANDADARAREAEQEVHDARHAIDSARTDAKARASAVTNLHRVQREADEAREQADSANLSAREIQGQLERANRHRDEMAREQALRDQRKDAEIADLKRKLARLQQQPREREPAVSGVAAEDILEPRKRALQDDLLHAIDSITKAAPSCMEYITESALKISHAIQALHDEETIVDAEADIRDQIRNLIETTGTKLRTYVAIRKGETNDSGLVVDKVRKQVTQAGGQPFGPFSDVFDDSSTNAKKYHSMKDLLDPIPLNGGMVVVFGYGYSGSGKTYTFFGGGQEYGIAQHAIADYIKNGYTVHMEDVFEMYNDTYTYNDRRRIFEYTQENSKQSYMHLFQSEGTEINVPKFNKRCESIETTRKTLSHILPTPNNKASSRGNLFIKLKISNAPTSTYGYLIICDMGGRENPKEIWETANYYKGYIDTKKNTTVAVLGPVSKTNSDVYYKYGDPVQELRIPSEGGEGVGIVTTVKAVLGDSAATGASLKSGLKATGGNAKEIIRKTLKQGFYINDFINELLRAFGYDFAGKGRQASTNWDGDEYSPDVLATDFSDKIGIKKVIEGFKKESKCNIKFCTFACIRQSRTFQPDTLETLKFASEVNSIATSSAAVSAGGGSLRKIKRNKNSTSTLKAVTKYKESTNKKTPTRRTIRKNKKNNGTSSNKNKSTIKNRK
jgi:hypothetical protein